MLKQPTQLLAGPVGMILKVPADGAHDVPMLLHHRQQARVQGAVR